MAEPFDPKALEALVQLLLRQAIVMDLHATKRKRPPGDNDFADSASAMREAADALSRPKAAEPARDDALLPNDVLDDNYARALAADGASGNMSMDTTLAITLIDEVRRSRAAPSATPQREPVAWRTPVNPFGQPGWSYAETEHASPHQPDTGMVMVPREPTDAMIEAGIEALREHTQVVAIDRDPLFVWRYMLRAAALPIEPERQT